MCGASAPKRATIARQASASLDDTAAIAAGSLVQIGTDAEKGMISEDAGKTVGGGRKPKPVRQQLILVGREEWRAGEHRQIHRAKVVPESRQRQFSRLHRAASFTPCLDDSDRPTAREKVDRRREAIVSRSDHHGINGIHPRPPGCCHAL